MFLDLFRSDCVGLYRGEALVCPLGGRMWAPSFALMRSWKSEEANIGGNEEAPAFITGPVFQHQLAKYLVLQCFRNSMLEASRGHLAIVGYRRPVRSQCQQPL
jgi:hypothetical protein